MIDPMQSASAGAARDDYSVVPLRSILQVLWRRLWVVAFAMVLVTGTAVGVSLLQTPQYEASTKIMIGQENRFKDDYVQPASELQALTKTMAEAVADTSIANAVIRELDLPMSPRSLLENLSAEAIEETQFVTITYRDPQPHRAQRVANAVGSVFSERISEATPSASAVTATVWQPATLPSAPVSPDPVRTAFLWLVLSGILGVGLVFLLEHIDNGWHSREEVEEVCGAPVLAAVPTFDTHKTLKEARRRVDDTEFSGPHSAEKVSG
jgi:capsular polysaccharide biosynthesis protein